MNNIMDVHKLSINLDINRYIEYTLMYIGYEYVGYVFIYTLMYSCKISLPCFFYISRSLVLLFYNMLSTRSSVGFSRNILKVYWSTRARTITKSESSNPGLK